jgi:cellulose synthase/poly-beta-1,6-N-acetylglucosamine synthase-like glycosyltransferase
MSISHPLAVLLWTCLAAVVYAYAGYPVLVWCLARLFGRRPSPRPVRDEDLPSLSLLIAAHNEEAVIEERLRNALAMDYPAEKLEVVVASDGSSDGTADIVRRYAGRRVRLLDYAQRRGKAAVLNSAFPGLRGEIVMLSDANTCTDAGAARKLVRWFGDPAVGVVCGRLVLTDPATGRNADSLYWKYETFLKRCEGRLGALLGANGAIYALRKELYEPLPRGTILDDFLIPLLAKLRTGCALLYDTEAVAHEETPAEVRDEFRRRSRIGAGGFMSVGVLWRLLDPRRGWVAFAFLSHKLLRWLCPFFLLALLGCNVALCREPVYAALLLAQAAFYLLSGVAAFIPARLRALKVLRLTTMFTSMNGALLVGFGRWLWGGGQGTWKRTIRLAEARPAAYVPQPEFARGD